MKTFETYLAEDMRAVRNHETSARNHELLSKDENGSRKTPMHFRHKHAAELHQKAADVHRNPSSTPDEKQWASESAEGASAATIERSPG